MKKIIYIGILAAVSLFSCSKEQPFSPASSSDTIESSQFTGDPGLIIVSDCGSNCGGTNETGDITDPEKEDKEKTNKKAKI